MKLAVVGGTGRTGQQVVRQALARGDDVLALSRNPAPATPGVGRLNAVAVDVLDVTAVTRSVADCDAVVSAVGIGTSRTSTTVYSQGVTNLLAAMHAAQVRRISVVSAGAAGPPVGQSLLTRTLVMPLLERVYGASYRDMRRMETVLQASELDWVCLRSPRLVDKPAGGYRLGVDGPPKGGASLTCAGLATALLDVLDRKDLYRRAVFVAT